LYGGGKRNNHGCHVLGLCEDHPQHKLIEFDYMLERKVKELQILLYCDNLLEPFVSKYDNYIKIIPQNLAILAHFLSKILCVNHTKLPFVAK
jgi:hypothetical protein